MNKTFRLNRRVKAAAWFTVCSFLQKGISFITVPVFIRLMTTEQYGTFTVYTSWRQILEILTSLYIFNGIYNNALSKFEEDRDRATSAFLGLTITLTLGEFGLYCLFRNRINAQTGLSSVFLMMMFLETLFSPAMSYWMARERFEYRYQRVVTVSLIRSVLAPSLGIYLVRKTGGLALGRIAAGVVIEIAFSLTFLILQFLKGRTFYSKKYWRYGLRLALPILPHYLSGMILSQGDRIVIDRLLGRSEVALYGLASSIGMLAQVFVTSINSAMTPWMYENMKKSPEAMRGALRFIMVFIASLCLSLMLISPELTLVFGTTRYAEAAYAIPPIAASVFFIFLYGVVALPEFYFEKTSFLAVSSLIAAGINIALNYLFIPVFGYEAAAYTTLVCYVLYSAGHYLVSLRILQNYECPNIVDEKSMILISVSLIVLTIVTVTIMDMPLLRYSALGLMAFAAFAYRKRIISNLKEIRK